MKFSSGFAALALAVVVSATPVRRDAATVESDIAAISSQLNTLNGAITRFGSSKSLIDALGIATDAEALNGLITKATADTDNSAAFTEAEGSTIVAAIHDLAPNIVATLQDLDGQHDNVASLPIPGIDGLIDSELNTLNDDTTALETALLSQIPADIQSQVQASVEAINTAFATAIATFAS